MGPGDRTPTDRKRLPATLAALVLVALASPAAGQAPWDTTAPRGVVRELDFKVSEGTGMSVDISPDGKWLLFDLLAHVYRVPVGGGEAEALTQDSGVALNYHPRYSPDGKSIVFVSDRSGQTNLWVMDSDGGSTRLIFDSPDSSFAEPTWSADGKAVIAVRQYPHALGAWTRTNRIWSIPINGDPPRELTGSDNSLVFAPTASPDGRHLYYHRTSAPVTAEGYFKVPTDHQIRRLELATGRDEPFDESARRRYYHREPFSDFAPRVSPDGRSIAFERRVPGGSTEHDGVKLDQQTGLWLRDLETGEEKLAVERLAPDQLETHTLYQIRLSPGYSWAKDAASIVYSEGGKLRRAWLSDGRIETIAFTAQVRRTISEQVRPQLRISDGPLEVHSPRWPSVSPDGRSLVFEAAGSLWRKPMGTAKPVRLLKPDARFGGVSVEMSPAWSPDGRWIAFATWSDERGGQLWKVAAAGGRPVQLTTVVGEYLNPSWSADGRSIVVAKGAGAGLRGEGTGAGGWNEIVTVSAAGGAARTLTRVATDEGFVRPTYGLGGRIYYASRTEPAEKAANPRFGTTMRSIAADGSDIRVHAGLAPGTKAVISPDGAQIAFDVGENLFVTRIDPGASTPAYVDAAPGSARRLTSRGGGFASWTSKGRLAFFQGPELKLFDPGAGTQSGMQIGLQIDRDLPKGDLALTNARILTMDERKVIEKGAILIRGNRIVAVGSDVPLAGVSKVIDLKGKTVAPGLIDIHAHHFGGGDNEIIPPHRARSANYLAYGVTTVFDPAAPTFSVFSGAEQTAAGKLLGPRVFSTGTPMYGEGGLLLTDRAFAADTAARLAEIGAIGLKQYYQPRRAQRQWATQAAREHGGLLVTGEGMDLSYNLGMVMDGQTAWEHPLLDLPLYDDVVQFVARSGTQYNPELITPGQGLYLIEYFMSEKDLSGDHKQQLWVPWKDVYRKVNFTRRPLSDYPAIFSVQGVKEIVRAGGKVGVGGHGQDQGLGTHREMWTFALALTPVEALEAATIVNARYLGFERDLGSITVGKIADLVILDADPLADIRNSLSVAQVMIDGRLYDGETLDEVWPTPRPYGPRRWMMMR